MKKAIHPEYRDVVFKDVSCGFEIITKSTIRTSDKINLNGIEYPMFKIDISSQSHPFYTGTQRVMDTEGRVDRFKKKYGKILFNI
jgi:large subunit ribosomal protein L31